MKIGVLDTGVSNLQSVLFCLDRIDKSYKVVTSAKEINACDRLIFPGVGSFDACSDEIKKLEIFDAILNYNRPLFGICLGMQFMCRSSKEGVSHGLSIFDADVKRLEAPIVPHMGWSKIGFQSKSYSEHRLFDGINDNDYFYFVHSYAVPIIANTIASTGYGGEWSAIIAKGVRFGAQFHPERSGALGQRLLKNFCEVSDDCISCD